MAAIATTSQGTSPSARVQTAWIYVRESQLLSAAGHGPDTQERECKALAEELGYPQTRIFVEVKSGYSMKKRPTWKLVERGVLRHECDALIVWEYSRISRNQADWTHFVDRAIRAGVMVLSTNPKERQWDWSTAIGRMALAMIGGVNEMYREKAREYTMSGNRTRALKGMPLVGKKDPYGYYWLAEDSVTTLTGATRLRKVRLVPDEQDVLTPDGTVERYATAPRLRAIWDYLDTPDPDHDLGHCTDWLNLVKHWPSPEGVWWTKNTLRYLLKQSLYWGEGEAFRTTVEEVRVVDPTTGEYDIEPRQRPRPVAERIRLTKLEYAPPLLSKEQAMRVRAYLAQKKGRRHYGETTQDGQPSQRPARTWNPDDFLLHDGLLRCGICGHKLYPGIRQGRAAYRCEAGNRHPRGHERRHQISVNAAVADSFAVQQTVKLLYTPGEAEAALLRLGEQGEEQNAELATAEAALARLDKALAAHRKLELYLEEDEVEQFVEARRTLNRDRATQAAKVAELQMGQQRVQSLSAALAAAMQAAREATAQAQAASPSAVELAEIAWRVHYGGDFSAQAIGIERSREAIEQAIGAMKAAGQTVQETVATFEHAPTPEQRTVLQALGVQVVVTPDEGHSASGRRKYRKGDARLRYDLPLQRGYSSGYSGSAGQEGHDAGHDAGGAVGSAFASASALELPNNAQFLSGIFFPIAALPVFLAPVVRALPLTYLGDALRQIVTGGTPVFPMWVDLAVLAAWAFVCALLAVRLFKWE